MGTEEIESLSFEDSYARLEQVIQQLEQGNLSLDESVALYQEGMQLAEHCDHELTDAELKVNMLLSAAAAEYERDERDALR